MAERKNILITGANFGNKGAQSMLFICTDRLHRIYTGCNIYFATSEIEDFSNYNFVSFFYNYEVQEVFLKKSVIIKWKRIFRDVVANFLKRTYRNPLRIEQSLRILKNVHFDIIIDISGYGLGDKWSFHSVEYYLNHIRISKKLGVPIYLMPQSFGPFGFSKLSEPEKNYLIKEIKKLLSYPSVIFARENDGKKCLERLGIKKLELSPDLVLQTKEIKLENVFNTIPNISVPNVDESNAVAIVPNIRLYQHGSQEQIIKLYRCIINVLLSNGKVIYIFRHSREDLELCKDIKQLFLKDNRVRLWTNDFSCIEYDSVVRQFEFIICSRFHGCVHALKNNIPVIAIGWAIKYQELLDSLNQPQYIFDATANNIEADISEAIIDMIQNLNKNKNIIKDKLEKIQQYNCFRIFD